MPPNAGPLAVELARGHWRVVVRAAVGGSIARFEHVNGTPVFLPVADLEHGAVDTGGCFPMVPFVNRVRNRRFMFQGKERLLDANLPDGRTVHGYGWQAAWAIAAVDAHSVHLVHEHEGGGWPSRYRAEQHVVVEPEGLRIALQITNCGDAAMPCGFGLHPYFPLRPNARLRVTAATSAGVGSDGFPARLAAAAAVLNTLASAGGPPANLYLSGVRGPVTLGVSGGWTVTIRTSGGFDELVVYVPPEAHFACIEPATHRVGALGDSVSGVAGGVAVLQPGETLSGSVVFAPSGYD